MEQPTRHLVPPQPADPSISGGYADPFDFFSILSPTDWIANFLIEITGWDPLGWICSSFMGDWQAFASCGIAYANLARACQDLGVNIQEGELRLEASWEGNAADAARAYFSDLAAKVSGMQIALDDAAQEYEKAARGAWLAANQVKNLLESIIDSAVIAAGCTAAGTALIETGAGAVVGYGLAALEVARITEMIARAGQIIQTAGMVIEGVAGTLVNLANQGGSLARYPLPAAAYHHPALS
ncbi:MAG TPA: hypothetical protein VF054_21505 [Micromonosporaceae bacterium]